LLAAAPVINLPVIRTIRKELLSKEAGQAHEAEVFLSGLLRLASGASAADLDPDEVLYDFRDGVREFLLDSLPSPDKRRVLEAISSYIEDRLGFERGRFRAMLADPKAAQGKLTPTGAPIARILADVLRRVGGDWEGLLETEPEESPQSESERWPRLDDLASLPRWAIVAFLARCCRRIQPLFSMALPNFSSELQQALDRELDFAERVAAERSSFPKDLTSQAFASEGILRTFGYSNVLERIPWPHPPEAPSAASVAAYVARAINCAARAAQAYAWDTAAEAGVNAGLLAVSRALKSAVRSSVIGANAEVAARREVLSDLGRLREALSDGTQPPFEGVAPELFGEIWPNGIPEGWPVTSANLLPLKEELAKLPRWALVALAARCVQRVEPLFRASVGRESKKEIQLLEEFVKRAVMAAQVAQAPGPLYQAWEQPGVKSAVDRLRELAVNANRPVVSWIAEAARSLNETVQLAAWRVGQEDIKLTSANRRALRDAFLDAFRDSDELDRFLIEEMGIDLRHIQGLGEPLDRVVFDLIRWAEALGKVAELLHAAGRYRPRNRQLVELRERLGNPPKNTDLATAAFDTLNAVFNAVHVYFQPTGSNVVQDSRPGSEVGALAAAALPEIKMLREQAEREQWEDDSPVPLEVFGPLWPAGRPEGWPRTDEGGTTAPTKTMPRRWIRVVGTAIYELRPEVLHISPLLGVMLAREGYGLIVGGFPGVDHVVASRFVEELEESQPHRADSDWLIQVVDEGRKPDYPKGRIIVMNDDSEAIQRSVKLADAVILVCGAGGAALFQGAARQHGKPVLPLAATGGAALEAFKQMIAFEEYPIQGMTRADFLKLELPVPVVVEALANLLRKLFPPVQPSQPQPTPPDPEDPQKGRWGSQAERDGRVLQAEVAPITGVQDWFTVRLTVRSTDPARPLIGTVLFHLHPTFHTPERYVRVESGFAVLELEAYDTFSVGAEVLEEGRRTPLELDLETVWDEPQDAIMGADASSSPGSLS
jgi:hypothetical protein